MTADAVSLTNRARIGSALYSTRLGLGLAALALPLTAAPRLDDPLPLPGDVSVFVSDVVVVLALIAWAAQYVFAASTLQPTLLSSRLLGLPVLLLFAALVPGIVRGHERYDASFVGQPLRLVIYAGVAAALVALRPSDLYRGLVAVFYAGAVWQAALACYHLATGTSQTDASILSTGGTRPLALGTGMYLAGALILALLNLLRAQEPPWRALHGGVAALATFGIAMTFGRTTFLAAFVVLIFLLYVARRRVRLVRVFAVAVPLAVIGAFVLFDASPRFEETLRERITANPFADRTFRWRVAAARATLAGLTTDRPEASGVVVTDPAPSYRGNQPLNGTFEQDASGWGIQGGELSVVDNYGVFGDRSLEIKTNDASVDEGAYSDLFAASRGERWTFTVWLRGASGGEGVNISIWEYDAQRQGIRQGNRPVTLSSLMTGYVVHRTIVDPSTTQIRALIRTRDFPQAVTMYVDGAHLQRRPPETPVAPASGGGVEPRVSSEPAGLVDRFTGPVLGLGFGRQVTFNFDGLDYEIDADPHNSFVYMLAGGGVLALGALLYLVFVSLKEARERYIKTSGIERDLVFWAGALWFVFAVNALMGPIFTEPRFVLTIWALMLLPAVTRGDAALSPGDGHPYAEARPARLDGDENGREAAEVRRRKLGQHSGPFRHGSRGERDRTRKRPPPEPPA